MEAGPLASERHAALDLSKVAGFTLGPLCVDPPMRLVSAGARSEMLEPRVMQVLVALGGTVGRVFSRDDLTEQCWDGVIVGNNAIDRVIFRLRHALEDLSGGAVRIETIPRVGYRLVCEQSTAEAATPPVPLPAPALAPAEDAETPLGARRLTRRAAAGGVTAIGAGLALSYATLGQPARHVPDPRAVELYQRGMLMRGSTVSENVMSALSYFKQAVAIDPEFADAWGAIAIFNASSVTNTSLDQRATPAAELARSAAHRALALDPDQGEAQIALVEIEPRRDRWLDHERRLRAIQRKHHDLPMANGALANFLSAVGKHEEAVALFQHSLMLEPSLPLCYALLAHAQHCAGRLLEADATLDNGFSRFPGHFILWMVRFSVLLGSRRYREAAAFARDPGFLPAAPQPQFQTYHVAIADALASGEGMEQQVTIVRDRVAETIQDLGPWAVILAELGTDSMIFDALEAHYLGGRFAGRKVPPPKPLDRRYTTFLFLPGVLAHRDNPRYVALLEQLGLEDYWRQSGTLPDYRRG